MEFDEEEWEYERPTEPEVWLIATRPVAAGDSLELKEDYSNEQRLCKYGYVDINRRKECNNMRFEVRVYVCARGRCSNVCERCTHFTSWRAPCYALLPHGELVSHALDLPRLVSNDVYRLLLYPSSFCRCCCHHRGRCREQKKILRAARIHAGILAEQFGSRYEQDALEPWQQRVLIELKLDGPEQDLTVHLGGDSTNGRLPVRRGRCWCFFPLGM